MEVGMVVKKVGEELIGRFIRKIKTRGHACIVNFAIKT
jgi:hypothetical protein